MANPTQHQFTPAVPVRAYERVVEQIERAILSGEIPVGTKLPSERDLMLQFDVSRPTIREALRILQSMGLLESKPGTRGGPVVLQPSPEQLSRTFRNLLGTDAVELADLLEFRMMLEGTACRLASLRRTTEQLAGLTALVEEMQRLALTNSPDFAAADLAFHAAVWEASGNQIVLQAGDAVSGILHHIMQQESTGEEGNNKRKLDSVRIDTELLEAIREQDGNKASGIARRAIAARFSPLLQDELRREALTALAQ